MVFLIDSLLLSVLVFLQLILLVAGFMSMRTLGAADFFINFLLSDFLTSIWHWWSYMGRRTLGAADQKTLSPAPMNTFAQGTHEENSVGKQ